MDPLHDDPATYRLSSGRPPFWAEQSAPWRWFRWRASAPAPPRSTRWAPSRTGHRRSDTAGPPRTAGPPMPSCSSLSCGNHTHKRVDGRAQLQTTNQTPSVELKKRKKEKKTIILKMGDLNLPVRMRADLCRRRVLVRPVLLGFFWQGLPRRRFKKKKNINWSHSHIYIFFKQE